MLVFGSNEANKILKDCKCLQCDLYYLNIATLSPCDECYGVGLVESPIDDELEICPTCLGYGEAYYVPARSAFSIPEAEELRRRVRDLGWICDDKE